MIFDFDPAPQYSTLAEANAMLEGAHAVIRILQHLRREERREWQIWRARTWKLFDLAPEGDERIAAITFLPKRGRL